MVGRRDKFQIINDILNLLQEKGKVKITHILYGSNLSYDRLKIYIEELKENRFIEIVKEKDKTLYKITDKGLKLISETKKFKEMMDAFGI